MKLVTTVAPEDDEDDINNRVCNIREENNNGGREYARAQSLPSDSSEVLTEETRPNHCPKKNLIENNDFRFEPAENAPINRRTRSDSTRHHEPGSCPVPSASSQRPRKPKWRPIGGYVPGTRAAEPSLSHDHRNRPSPAWTRTSQLGGSCASQERSPALMRRPGGHAETLREIETAERP